MIYLTPGAPSTSSAWLFRALRSKNAELVLGAPGMRYAHALLNIHHCCRCGRRLHCAFG